MTLPEKAGSIGHVTDLAAAPQRAPEPATELDRAVRVAEAAALASGVTVRELAGLGELEQVVDLYAGIWGRSTNPPVTLELLRAFTKAGNYVGGAFAEGRLVGACVGFFHAPGDDALHSHIAGVSPEVVGRSVGFALKLHQRSWALLRGVSDIAWTFDPLVSRNAYFNVGKLAARPVEYLTNFYGLMPDSLNGQDETDRLLVRWRLLDPAVVAACSGTRVPFPAGPEGPDGPDGEVVTAVGVGDDGSPVPGRLDAAVLRVAVPRDISGLRVTDPVLAHRWRTSVREALAALLADGARITAFDPAGWYVVRRDL
ncbi:MULTISPECIES: GNAT family N-acetyltransferase [unclassified Nocardioides]|uniref:GNAT family N-acetyltransferase n=1 Tax=unclassified Nocardioides TaxID=2615069 RepID=UPI002666EECD|nr:GNAT family N-acetyltransferase [Nocardioides sp. Arc9.136]WKN48993.1 GNAT family N-acetyltransferase [Nocardioides sp. Arc9.136]